MLFCEETLHSKEDYYEHLEDQHSYQFKELLNYIKELGNEGHTIEKIEDETILSKKYLSDKIGEIRESPKDYNSKKSTIINKWQPEIFKLETTTVWSFPNRGNWATHSGKYRGNWSPYIPRNIILRYSKKDDIILDQFLGSGTTLIECKLLERKGIGVDINPEAIKLAMDNLRFSRNKEYEPHVYNGDARRLDFIDDKSIDLICTHPPYANIIKYSANLDNDLSLLDIDEFVEEMKKVAQEAFRVLKGNKYCAIFIGDTRRNKHMVPLGFKVMQTFIDAGFLLKETIIKEQHNCKATGFWYNKSIEHNFLLIAHEYLFIFRKPN